MLNFLVALLVVTQPPPAAPPRQPATVGLASADIRVTDRTGVAIEGTTVAAEGTSSRGAVTTADGRVLFRTMAPGAYRIRASRKGFVTLEKGSHAARREHGDD